MFVNIFKSRDFQIAHFQITDSQKAYFDIGPFEVHFQNTRSLSMLPLIILHFALTLSIA